MSLALLRMRWRGIVPRVFFVHSVWLPPYANGVALGGMEIAIKAEVV